MTCHKSQSWQYGIYTNQQITALQSPELSSQCQCSEYIRSSWSHPENWAAAGNDQGCCQGTTYLPNSPIEYIYMDLVRPITPTSSKGNKGTDIGSKCLQIRLWRWIVLLDIIFCKSVMSLSEISHIKLKSMGKGSPISVINIAIIIFGLSVTYLSLLSHIKLKSIGKGNPNLSHHVAIIIFCKSVT